MYCHADKITLGDYVISSLFSICMSVFSSHAEADILAILAYYLVPILKGPTHILGLQPSTTGKLATNA